MAMCSWSQRAFGLLSIAVLQSAQSSRNRFSPYRSVARNTEQRTRKNELLIRLFALAWIRTRVRSIRGGWHTNVPSRPDSG